MNPNKNLTRAATAFEFAAYIAFTITLVSLAITLLQIALFE